MKLLVTGLALVGFGCAAFTVTAATSPDISWNYLSAGYAKANIKISDGPRFKPDGYQLNGSYLLSNNIYLRGSYFDVTLSDTGVDLDTSEVTLSLGMRDAISHQVDSFFEAGYGRSVAKLNNVKETDNGVQASAGFRCRVTADLELDIAARYSDLGDDEIIYGDLSARYRITPMFDFYASYQFESDVSIFATGVVFNF
ncbi:outer membrane beta-barrel protein [Rheinheimera baltica]|uniref:outer membrane beta-barrel protein n=1 Tax=Rheinheimera baltica TaxID=67576 RepID=UPI000417FF2E|nr:outer membrane beta-barrel protein [Rheinheimera baltica]MDP5191538.1 outer membrane beta-barrel protein [Rheinheimera baltica]